MKKLLALLLILLVIPALAACGENDDLHVEPEIEEAYENDNYPYDDTAIEQENEEEQGEEPLPPTPPPTPPIAEIPDTIIIGDMVIPTAWLALDLSNQGLTEEDIAPLRYMVNLEYLNLSGNAILDISQTPIPQMTGLLRLNLGMNRITDKWHRGIYFLADISALANLTNLRELYL